MTITAGCRSIIPLKVWRAASYPSSPGLVTVPLEPIESGQRLRQMSSGTSLLDSRRYSTGAYAVLSIGLSET